MADRSGFADTGKRLTKTGRPSIDEIIVVIEGIAAREESRKIVFRAKEVEIDAHFIRMASTQVGQRSGRLIPVRVRVSRAEIIRPKN